jgi:hypothetical protein
MATFGTKSTFDTGNMAKMDICRMDDTHIVAAWSDFSATGCYVRAASVSGTTPTWGSKVKFESGNADSGSLFIAPLSSTKFIIVFSDSGDTNKAKGIIGTLSGTTITISLDSATGLFNNITGVYPFAVDMLTDSKFVTAARRSYYATGKGQLQVCTVSGTTIIPGTEYNFLNTGNSAYELGACDIKRLADDRFILAWSRMVGSGGRTWSFDAYLSQYTVSGTTPSTAGGAKFSQDFTTYKYVACSMDVDSTTKGILTWSSGSERKLYARPFTLTDTTVTANSSASELYYGASYQVRKQDLFAMGVNKYVCQFELGGANGKVQYITRNDNDTITDDGEDTYSTGYRINAPAMCKLTTTHFCMLYEANTDNDGEFIVGYDTSYADRYSDDFTGDASLFQPRTTVTEQIVTSSTNDATDKYRNDTNVSVDYRESTIEIGHEGGHMLEWSLCAGFRFTGVNIPKGATIHSAKLTLTANGDYSSNNVNVRVYGIDVDDAPAWSTDNRPWEDNYTQLTSAYVNFSILPSWTTDNEYDFTGLASIVQEITDRNGWASGNDLALIINDNGSDIGRERNAYDYSSSASKAAKLEVVYSYTGTGTFTGDANLQTETVSKIIFIAT